MNSQIIIEPPQMEDVKTIVEVHYASVHQIAASFYSRQIIDSWSPPIISDRIERFKQTIQKREEWLVVAKQDNRVVGFGSIVPQNHELRALYVHPDFSRQGIGAKILGVLEQEAVSRGLLYLQMNASINAESFYRKHGFEIIEYTTHRLNSGQDMACVKMRKALRVGGV